MTRYYSHPENKHATFRDQDGDWYYYDCGRWWPLAEGKIPNLEGFVETDAHGCAIQAPRACEVVGQAVSRYSLERGFHAAMQQDSIGDYVRYEDYATLFAELDRARKIIDDLYHSSPCDCTSSQICDHGWDEARAAAKSYLGEMK